MVVSYEIVDKQYAWQQDRSPEGGDGPHCKWVQWRTSKLQSVYVKKTFKKNKFICIDTLGTLYIIYFILLNDTFK